MRAFEYEYTICPQNDSEQFNIACDKIKNNLKDYEYKGLFVLADYNLHLFMKEAKEIRLYDDYFAGLIYVKSDVKLDFFEKQTA